MMNDLLPEEQLRDIRDAAERALCALMHGKKPERRDNFSRWPKAAQTAVKSIMEIGIISGLPRCSLSDAVPAAALTLATRYGTPPPGRRGPHFVTNDGQTRQLWATPPWGPSRKGMRYAPSVTNGLWPRADPVPDGLRRCYNRKSSVIGMELMP